MKTKLVLLMYDALLCGGSVLRDDFCKEYKISERTFYRYLLAVSKFFRIITSGKTARAYII